MKLPKTPRHGNSHNGALVKACKELLAQLEGPIAVYGDGRGRDGRKTGLSYEEFNALRQARIEQARAAIAQQCPFSRPQLRRKKRT